jgi:very-short-patch-repair endonuclease
LPTNWKDPAVKTIEPLKEHPSPDAEDPGIEKFEALPERVRTFAYWKGTRDEWAQEALPAQQALAVFNRLYELQGRLEREGESVQLVLGQGILCWQRQDGDIRHPVATQTLQLAFDPFIPEFTVSDTGQPPELLRPLLFVTQEAAAHTIQQADEELALQDSDLLDARKIEGPLRRIAAALHSEGQFIGTTPAVLKEYPQISCDPVIYLHRRTQGFATALDFVLQDIATRTELPPGLLRISGIAPPVPELVGDTRSLQWEEPPEILFTKEANEEQFQIADRLNRFNNVLVQGPPGTGKTHTIANLIGHLLAHGKRVLVTAHTSKALRVLRDKVVNPLQTLCVSVLDNETESRKQLEASVDEMVARLTSENPARLDREADALDIERRRLIKELSALRQALVEARRDEYRDLILAGVATSPSDAARFVSNSAAQNSWIPEPIEAGAPAPLTDDEVHELYTTKARLTADDEKELRRWRPLAGEVPGGDEFATESDRWRTLQQSDRTTGAQFWSEDALWDADSEELANIDDRVRDSVGLLAGAPLWKLDDVAAGMKGFPEALLPWTELIDKLEALNAQSRSSLGLLLDNRCALSSKLSAETQCVIAREVRELLEGGGALTSFRLMTKPDWRKFITTTRVNDAKPESSAHFNALGVCAALTVARHTVGTRWNNQITRRGGPRWEEFGESPEDGAVLLSPTIRRLLSWHTDSQEPLVQSLIRAGFKWDEFINGHEVAPGEHMELRRLVSALVGSLPKIVAARINALQLAALERKFQLWNRALFSADLSLLPASAVLDLRMAVNSKDYAAYDVAYRRLTGLHALSPEFERCCVLIERLRRFASQWASAIENRIPPHVVPEPPGSVVDAWKWLQYRQELQRRGAVSIADIQQKIHDLDTQLRRTTARLIELRSWSAQCKRVGLEEQQALQGWKDINRRIGRGTGRRVPGLRAEARRTLARARNAVPVWIMPLSRVAESFDPRTARFDVVIIDEASQCDVMGLLALYLAKQAVVVGDHEQVSPAAVGQEIAEVEHLISQHLSGIPNNRLYDGRMSLYDLARQSFGGLIRLLEHFRCVPEIISFSNDLSYNGAIKPLRDSTTEIKPSLIPYRVEGIRGNGKINIQEARNIIALLLAAIEQPEYTGKSFGAVSLLGEEQAIQIESLAREMLLPSQLFAIQFLCGTAAQFQGDERDVVFLSMVDSPTGGPLRMRQEDLFRQRFNVAASRSKDQLWVVHSLDPKRDLQPGDLRRRLIEHAEHPDALLKEQLAKANRTESEFERLVLDRLIRAAYRVHPQYPVGHYRIDLVVEGSGHRRLAVECDGDRFHPIDKIADDMARQAVLERIGWKFVRIRGSHFFRDPDSAMVPVFERLSQLGILPLGNSQTLVHADSSSDLLDRLRIRATEVLHDWDEKSQNFA